MTRPEGSGAADGSGTPPERPADDLGFEVPDDLSELVGLSAAEGRSAPEDRSAPEGLSAPDDLSALEAAGPAPAETGAADRPAPVPAPEPVVALVVTQVAGAKPLAAACALAGVDVDAVPSPVGAIAVLRDTQHATRTAAAAAAISQILRTSPVVLLDRRAGRISASRWQSGQHDDDLAPGLVLSGAPEVLEDLLLGSVDLADVDGTVTSVGMSRWSALRALRTGRRGQA